MRYQLKQNLKYNAIQGTVRNADTFPSTLWQTVREGLLLLCWQTPENAVANPHLMDVVVRETSSLQSLVDQFGTP